MGHALNSVLQDILSRWKRMSGFRVLWLPGTDHAGIATQNVVEKQLAAEGLDRHTLGRDAFTDRIWKWKSESGGTIIHQLKRLGASCDWSRERFTLDEGLSRAVREVFVRLFEEGLIYRDNRLINWCPRCHTALSDLEVEYDTLEGKLTYIQYPLADRSGKSIPVATTRPETMLGDTAVAVHPEDERYRDFIGKKVALPLTTRKIPVIADPAVDPSFGTGAVKVTPAHDFNDEAIAKRQKPPLPFLTVIGEDGRMTFDAGEKYSGLDRYECRKLVRNDLRERKLIIREEPHQHAVGHCYRCKTITEPLSALQWYVNVRAMAREAIQAVRTGRIRFIPQSWENTFFAWMEDIRDWCISRQIWWGHRIPVWYCPEQKNTACKSHQGINVSREDPGHCVYCGSSGLRQDNDVLDTWFSSALWPFSTFGWPDDTDDLKTYYPTSVLVTGFDIIFFWVARMTMMGLKFMKEVPFRDVYIHALVRDMHGMKMSKSKGNVVDPLIMMDRYGTDAFRFTLAAFAAQGRDVKFSEDRVEGYRHFVNKLWNAARFIMMNREVGGENNLTAIEKTPVQSGLASNWILSRLAAVTEEINTALGEYRFNDAASSIYQFIWHEFCDWYIEMAKCDLRDNEKGKEVQWCLLATLDTSLKLLHPFMPYVTEEIWQKIPQVQIISPAGQNRKTLKEKSRTVMRSAASGTMKDPESKKPESIMVSDYPKSLPRNPQAEEDMFYLIEAVTGIRTMRGELNIAPSLKVNVFIKTYHQNAEKILRNNLQYLKALARAEKIMIGPDIPKPEGSATSVKTAMEIFVPLKAVLNISSELDRLKKDLAKIEESLAMLNKKLMNDDFLQRAPQKVVEKEKTKYEELLGMQEKITDSIHTLKEAEVKSNAEKKK